MAQCIHLAAHGYSVRLTRVDIQRKPTVDLAQSKQHNLFLDRIRAKEFDAILLSPPLLNVLESTLRKLQGATAREELHESPRASETDG